MNTETLIDTSTDSIMYYSVNGNSDVVDKDFSCNHRLLVTLNGCPRVVHGTFYCDSTRIRSLEGGPEEVSLNYVCDKNIKLKTLKGCAKKIGAALMCNECPALTDISDLPSSCKIICVRNTTNITEFTMAIDDKLTFKGIDDSTREKIRNWPYYKVESESKYDIVVSGKQFNEVFMECL